MNVPASLLDLRYPGTGGHVESWRLVAGDRDGRRGIWLTWSVTSRPRSADRRDGVVPPIADITAVAFDRDEGHVATKVSVPFTTARFMRGALDVAIDGCELSLGKTRGTVESGDRAIAWDLAVGPELAAPVVHLPKALYATSIPPLKRVTPLASGAISGALRVNGRTWPTDGWRAAITHAWGPSHPHLSAWVHCDAWDDAEDLVFEGVSARVRVGPVLSPMATSLFVRWRGESWDLGGREILGQSRGLISLRRWEATSKSKRLWLRAELAAETDDLVGIHRANPRGSLSYCLGTRLARARLELARPGESLPFLVATSRAAALSIVTRDPTHGVRMYV